MTEKKFELKLAVYIRLGHLQALIAPQQSWSSYHCDIILCHSNTISNISKAFCIYSSFVYMLPIGQQDHFLSVGTLKRVYRDLEELKF